MKETTKQHLNELARSTSPYLKQHAADPVDWRPWCGESIAEAVRRDVPIFLSVGYAACHWCHVMQHEVFQNATIAKLMNTQFVNIKVDREERPDIDEAYMLATQIFAGSGGWPMSVWLTPTLKPFYAGTYFPPQDVQGRTGFPRLIAAISAAWQDNRQKIEDQANKIWVAMEAAIRRGTTNDESDLPNLLSLALNAVQERFDFQYGGFTGRPKFPPHQMLLLWVQLLERHTNKNTADQRVDGATSLPAQWLPRVEQMLTLTLDQMQWGGIHDLVGGGFARYSTDERWHVPHFEKMLYDNAQLAEVYARAACCLNRRDYACIAERILDFWLDHMSDGDGLCFSSLDADSDGAEGKYYTWDWKQLADVLAARPTLFDFAVQVLDISHAGNWEGTNVLQLNAAGRDFSSLWFDPRWREITSLLDSVRQLRPPPHTDQKIVTAWNGLMLSALAHGARLENGHRYRMAGMRLVSAIQTRTLTPSGTVLRSVCGQSVGGPGFLDDHAFLARGLIDWARLDTQSQNDTLALAEKLIDNTLNQFSGPDGELRTSADIHQSPLQGMRADFDNAVPSPSAILIGAMLDLDAVQHVDRHAQSAGRAVEYLLGSVALHPTASATLLATLERHSLKLGTAPLVTWQVRSVTTLTDGTDQIEIEARVPEKYHFQQTPRVGLTSIQGESESRFDGIQWTVVHSTGRPVESEHANFYRYLLNLTSAHRSDHKQLRIAFTLCDDQVCLPEMYANLDTPLPGKSK